MKKIGTELIRLFCAAAAVFTVGTVLLDLILLASNKPELALPAERSLWLFLYSVLCGSASVIRRQPRIHAAVRYTFHFLLTVGGFFLCVLLPSGFRMQSSSVFVLAVLLCVLYALVLGVCLAIAGNVKRKKRQKDTPYVSQYKGSEDNK